MALSRSTGLGFLEKMLGPLPGSGVAPSRWIGDPVRDHLTLLLNSRQGSVPNLPDYGLPDMSSFMSEYPNSLSELRGVLERLLRKYEPRLHNPSVRLVESDATEFKVSFLILGEVETGGDERIRVKYRTTISGTGHAALGED